MGIVGQAFREDKVIFEVPNKLIQSTPNPQIMPTANDRGITIFNRTIKKLARDEARA